MDAIYRNESRRVYATLVRLLGDMDLAEDALHQAFEAAVEKWPTEGIPANPRSWLVSTGRFKAIDAIRRDVRFKEIRETIKQETAESYDHFEEPETIEDDRLKLIFTCCHPAIAFPIQIALTLREVCGLSTAVIAKAFLVQTPTMAQRIVRGKAKIRDAGIPYRVPSEEDLPERLDSVLNVIYLIFNEGYSVSTPNFLTQADLANEAIRLCKLLLTLLPDPEVMGLLALMLLQESRRQARLNADGDIVLLEHQNRDLWDRDLIEQAQGHLQRAFATGEVGSYCLEAAIAAVHARAPDFTSTDWNAMLGFYDLLMQAAPSPIVALNRAVVISIRQGPQAGLAALDPLATEPELASYHLFYSARADFHRQLQDKKSARRDYLKALALVPEGPEQRFLQMRLGELKEKT